MHLSEPIRAIVPSLDGAVLDVLARSAKALSGREVARLARRGSPRGVSLALGRLVAQGIVLADVRPAGTFFVMNRRHLAWPAVETLATLRERLFQAVEALVGSWTTAPVHASIFGSMARAEGDEASDIDVLVIRPADTAEDDPQWSDHIHDLRESVAAWTGNPCHILEMNPARLGEHLSAHDPLVDSLVRDGITVCGATLSRILRQPLQGIQ